MSSAGDSRRWAELPLYGRIADVLAAAALFAVVAGSALGLSRYFDGRDHRRAMQAQTSETARELVRAYRDGGAAGVRTAAERAGVASVHVVTSGAVDEFGIARGAEVTLAEVRDASVRPLDGGRFEQRLLDRAAELESFVEAGDAIPEERQYGATEVGGQGYLEAFEPIVGVGGDTEGLLRVTVAVGPPPYSVPSWRFWLGLLAAMLLTALAGLVDRRLLLPAVPAAAILVTLAGTRSVTFSLTAAAFGLALGYVALRWLASVLRGLREQPTAYGYIAPAILGMVLLVFVPFVMGVGIAFFTDGEFTGLENFREILLPDATQHPSFYWTLGVTILWTVSNVVLHVGIGVALALILNRPGLRFRRLYRVLLIVPWAVPNYITALIWKSMFNPQFGAINALLDVAGVEPVNWLGPGSTFGSNFMANLVTNTWLGFPFMMVVTLGALQSIPSDLYEAAEIDGASRWDRFRHVTLPLLKPALVPAIILGVIWTFNMFNVIYLVSGGGPDRETNILITEAYHAFKVLGQYGMAAAYSLLIFVILLLYGWLQNRVTRATEGAFE